MDNTNPQNPQPQANPAPQVPQAGQVFQAPQMPQTPVQQPPQPQDTSPTLQDLYGPSILQEQETAAAAPMPQPIPQPMPQPMPQPVPQQEIPEQQVAASLPDQEVPETQAYSEESYTDQQHNFFPKPLRILLGVLVLVVVIIFGVRFISGMLSGGSSGKVTLTYWGLWEDTNVMQPVIADFERQNPNITVNYIKEDPKQYSQRLMTRVQQGDGPDIFRYHISWIPMISSLLSPLPSDVLSKQDLSEYFPVISRDIVKHGAVLGVPLGIDTLSLFVNKDIFTKAKATVPTTWDDFITVSRGLTQKDANGKITVSGASLGTFDNITHAPDILSLLFVQNGVSLASLTPAENASDALAFYTSFAQDQSNVWDNTLDMSQLGFARGEVAMYFGYSWDMFLIKAANPSLNMAIYPVPHLPGRNSTIASYWVEGVSNKSKHQKEAMLFMKYLAQKDTLVKLYTQEAKTRQFGELYPRKDLADTIKNNDLLMPFISQAQDAQSSFFAGETQDTGINAQMNGYLGNAVRSVLGNTSAQSAIQTLTQGVSQVLKQYGQTQ